MSFTPESFFANAFSRNKILIKRSITVLTISIIIIFSYADLDI